MDSMTTSVLMCVYGGDAPDAVAASLASLTAQTRMPDQIVLVIDGPVPEPLSHIIDASEASHPALFTIVRLERNQGLIAALNQGIVHCRGEYVLRMDADDICREDRIEKQLAFMSRHPEVGVLGSAMREFDVSPITITRIKPVRESHEQIARQLAWRNPVNHPTVCIRRHLLPATGYPELRYLEDYFLWAVLMAEGVRFHNLSEPLIYYRFNDDTLARRSGWVNFRNEVALRLWMYRHRLIGLTTLVAVTAMQLLLRFAPRSIQRRLWRSTRQSRG